MKFCLFLVMLFTFATAFSQDIQFKICAHSKSITVDPEDHNEDKLLLVNSDSDNNLTINVINDEIDQDWKRSFSIYDSADNAIGDFTFMKNGNYCIKFSGLKTKLTVGQEYFIYTIAIPKDPAKAMLVKVARTFVCNIKTR